MMNSIRKTVLILCLVATASTAMAQKAGHTNFAKLAAMMPESKVADAQLAQYQNELVAKGESMTADFKNKFETLYAKIQADGLSPAEQQAAEDELRKEQEAILSYEDELVQNVASKREELLNPIIKKVEKAIEQVAKENGYELIFDTSLLNTVLMADDTIDITELVKAKLGI